MAKSGRMELGDNIYRHYRSIFNHCDVTGPKKTRLNNLLYGIKIWKIFLQFCYNSRIWQIDRENSHR